MYTHEIHPSELKPETLDEYLSKGYFRMGQKIFTISFISFDRTIFDAIWLRINLTDYIQTSAKLGRLKSRFTFEYKPLQITPEMETLYQAYLSSRPFNGASSLYDLLFDQRGPDTLFHSYSVLVHDQFKLIGVGIFDLGDSSAAGIVTFFDPDYSKFSLGKLIILSKIEYCKDRGFQFFYPGYFVPGYPPFDYKIRLVSSGLEFLNVVKEGWFSFSIFDESNTMTDEMLRKLSIVHFNFPSLPIMSYFLFYQGRISRGPVRFFDLPYFMVLKENNTHENFDALVYDCKKEEFIILLLSKIDLGILNNDLLIVKQAFYRSKDLPKIITFIKARYFTSF